MAGESLSDAVGSTSLADLALGGVLAFGDGYRTMQAELGSSGFPILRVAQVADGFIRPASPMEYVREEFRRSIGPKLSRPDDVVLTTKGTFGRRAYVRPEDADYVYSPQVCWFRVVDRARIDPRYLYSWLGSSDFTNQAHGMKSQTDMADYLSLRDLARINVPLPPLPRQRAIAHILGTLDDKIELNRRTSETLEAIERTLFKSWFIDFDPVRAKSEGRDPGLPPQLADLFPDCFEDSELGEIPKGWKVGSIDGEFALTMGQSPPGDTYNLVGDGMPFYQGRTDFGFRFPTRRVHCTAPTRFAKAGDTLVSVRAPVGAINMASEDCAIGRGLAAVRHRNGSRSYSYQFMRSIDEVFARFEAEGTVFGSIGKQDFHAIPCASPPRELVLTYEASVSPLDDRIEVNEREDRTLDAVREALLPKLIAGALSVKNAARLLAAAT